MSRYTASPLSSSRDESVQGTPQTNLTMFSPEDVRLYEYNAPANRSAERPQQASQNDPFVSSSSTQSKADQKLSATASTFQPWGLRVPGSKSTSGPIPGSKEFLTDQIEKATSPSRSSGSETTQFGQFTSNSRVSRCIKISSVYKKDIMPLVEASCKSLLPQSSGPGPKIKGALRLKDEGDVVYVRLFNVSDSPILFNIIQKSHDDLTVEYISSGSVVNVIFSPTRQQQNPSTHEGQVVLRVQYPATRTASKHAFEKHMHELLTSEGPFCAWQKIVATEAGIFHLVAEYEDCMHAARAIHRLHNQTIGDSLDMSIISLTEQSPDDSSPAKQARNGPATTGTPTRRSHHLSEQTSLTDAMGSMNLGNGAPGHLNQMGGFSSPASSIMYTPTSSVGYMPGTPSFGYPQVTPPLVLGRIHTPQSFGQQSQYGPHGFGQFSPTHLNHQGYASSMMAFSPRNNSYNSPRSMGSGSGYYDDMMMAGPRDENYYNRFTRGRQVGRLGSRPMGYQGRSNQPGGQHNHVDIEKIQLGTDVRTTVMLRNIPNKVDQQMLKEMIDDSSFGTYDFMYLRIDFSNNCNVGYAFINFVDPLHIIDFVRARSNQKWQRFKSEKVAEVSYATIQGRDCLIQKFRNSSVMLEPEHYRPKVTLFPSIKVDADTQELFWTHQDQNGLAGQEEPFPSSDNSSKLKRSCENAEHVGLFAPSAGQHLRDEQRRRRSQYDRGTSLAERDEFYDDNFGYGSCKS
ncbi:RNA recognition domain-containing protein [Marssonina coronariae]|uniref:RNA recognition domain-containing protein n=1 Tax=Diplocarpon coronariae TaxID=2795749 RepID=A0A218ZBT5_9HELO|nr:RNA recognition domain-containing protein [Marssonina coronariae]